MSDAGEAPIDATGPCSRDVDCDDGVYCNGAERCDTLASGADARGCVLADDRCTLTECLEEEERCATDCDRAPDADDDGVDSIACGGTDCDDDDRARHPGATEVCDAADVDEDCDPTTFGFRDADGDSHPDAACCNTDSDGTEVCGTDCNDLRPNIHPTAGETCEGEDDDCDTRIDEGVERTFYVDADGDGRGDPMLPTVEACFVPTGHAEIAGDCDDDEPSVFVGATETCDAAMLDEDCDGEANPTTLCSCSGTGSRACLADGVCRLGTERCVGGAWGACSISPGIEMCNLLDDDCDGLTDEDLLRVCFSDPDDDTWAAPGAETMMLCPVTGRAAAGGCPIGFTSRVPLVPDLDCDEGSAGRHPGAAETCNAVDDDCDSVLDEGLMRVERYVDADGDGVAGQPVMRCEGDPGSVAIALDCNELRTDVFRGATELCDRRDNNCSLGGAAAGGVDLFEDQDGDGYAPIGALCTGGFPRTDCNDDPAAGGAEDHPGAIEVCSGRDTDCDGTVDEDPAAFDSCGGTNASVGCASDGVCRIFSCDVGFGDCNGTEADGCETTLATSSSHCGGCGIACAGGSPCVDGLCDVIVAIDAAEEHTCVRFASGGVSCGGENRNLQLGDGTRTDRSSLVPVVSLLNGTELGAGQQTTCVVRTGGVVACWGQNASGALGDGTTVGERFTPVAVVGLAGPAVEVASGNLFSCARLASGVVQCWGMNTRGQLGNGTTSTGPTATPVNVLGISTAVAIAVRATHACAVLADGTVRCWGGNDNGSLGDGTTTDRPTPVVVAGVGGAVAVGVGVVHACALRSDGTVSCWGRAQYGRIGDGTTADVNRAATAVVGVANATRLSVGANHACVLRTGGVVSCWGDNAAGELGDGSTTNRAVPVDTGVTDAVEVSAGGIHTCTLRVGGRMSCWGGNVSGQLLVGTTNPSLVPIAVPGLQRVADVAGGGTFACARRSTGTVACWGDNGYGELATGTVGGATRLTPVAAPGLTAVAIDAALEFACAIRPGGQLVCWGRLATGTTATPVPMAGITDAVAIHAGYDHACVLRASRELWCWGSNGSGQLGDGSTTARSAPVRVSGLGDVRSFATSRSHTCAIDGRGRLYCWGANSHGQLGTGSAGGTATTPRLVGYARDYVAVAAGNTFTCAVRATGALACWGNLLVGGVATSFTTPRVVTGLPSGERIESLDVSDGGSICAAMSSERLYCWGSANSSGELGLGHQLPTELPSVVLVHSDFDGVATATALTCGVRDDRRALACWGAANRLGNGSALSSSSPVTVSSFP